MLDISCDLWRENFSVIYDVLIVGGGAAGLFLAANLHGLNVVIIEKNASVGKKILASGGGRCNITNRFISAKNYLGDEKFIINALKTLKFNEVLDFFNELKFSEQKDAQFFCENGAKSVLNALLSRIKAKIYCSHEVTNTTKNGEIFELVCANGAKFQCKKLVVATGGVSYKTLGASDIGIKIAQSFGLESTPFSPALVGFSVQKDEFWFKNLSGVSLKADVKVPIFRANSSKCSILKSNENLEKPHQKAVCSERNFSSDVLFTHRGISGPAILNASLFWQKGQISINFLPHLVQKNLTNVSQKDIETIATTALNQGKKQLSSVLGLPRNFVLEFLLARGLKDAPFASYNATQKAEILRLFDYRFAPAGTFGFEKAEVSKGGVKTEQINENFEAKSINGLYFIGEVLDVTGMLGGFNLHFAFASAKCVANTLLKELNR